MRRFTILALDSTAMKAGDDEPLFTGNESRRRNDIQAPRLTGLCGLALAFLALTTCVPAKANLVIIPTFDTSITNDPNAETIENTINTAIASYEAKFSDPIVVSILFQEGSVPLAESDFYIDSETYSDYLAALTANATTSDDATAIAHLPPGPSNPLTGNAPVYLTTPNSRALGFNASPPSGQPDGTIILNTSIMNLSRSSTDSTKYDLMSTVSNEIDAVLGFISTLDQNFGSPAPIAPLDLFRYAPFGTRSYSTATGTVAYFSLDGTTDLAQFNQTGGVGYGCWFEPTGEAYLPKVQDCIGTPGAAPDPGVELTALDVIGYHRISSVGVLPSEGGNSGPVNVLVTGSSLLSGAQLSLQTTGLFGNQAIPGTNTSNPSSSSLSATFDLTGATPTNWNVVISPAGGAAPIVLTGAFTVLSTAACSYTVAPLNPSFPASGGSGAVAITSNVNSGACNFHACESGLAAGVNWISSNFAMCHVIVGGLGFRGTASPYNVLPNTSPLPRSVTVSVDGQNVTISQAGASTCSYSLNRGNETVAAAGGTFTVNVTTAAGCSWSATSALSWVHVIGGSPGSGNGTVTLEVDANTGGLRAGAITIAGQGFGVNQTAGACGASDVSSQVAVSRGVILSDFIGETYTESVTLQNPGPTSIPGPVYLVLDGLPKTSPSCGLFLGQPQTCGVTQATRLTHCDSPSGSDMVLFAPNGLGPGQAAPATLTFVPGSLGGAVPPSYSTRVFSGVPNQ